jgi:hypothetical protein
VRTPKPEPPLPASTAWRRFLYALAGSALGGLLAVFLCIAIIDPWQDLPLSPPLDRTPVDSNARFAHPALARSPAFDSAIIGTSTSRLLRPSVLDPLFGARFANLAMNAATAYEQSRLLEVFARAHPSARVIAVGLDAEWCVTGENFPHFTPRPFPEWMYGDNRWAGYLHLLNLDAVEQASREFGIVTHVRHPTYGSDGYTSFVPDDRLYDLARARTHLLRGALDPPGARSGPPESWHFPALDLLAADLQELPASTLRLLFFVPYHVGIQPASDDLDASTAWSECRTRVLRIADETQHTVVVDFMRATPITLADDNYWDSLHTRVGIADRVARDLAAAARGETSEDYLILYPSASSPSGPQAAEAAPASVQ